MKNDIRFLVTNTCNYDCYFCHREGVESLEGRLLRQHQLTVDDYVILYKLYSEMEGWNGVTLSGGEPLLYKEIDTLLKKLKEEEAEITIVTNGSLLHSHLLAMKYIKRINVSIHTMDAEMYSQITNREPERLYGVEDNLSLIKELYPEIKIRLNVTPCKNQNWSLKELKRLINFAEQIGASVKCTELFPNNTEDCIKIETLREEVQGLGYNYIPTQSRTECYEKEKTQIYLTQCTCSKAILFENPIEYCRKHHDLYVNCNGTFPLCRLGTEKIDFWEEIKERDLEILKMKMQLAQRRISKEKCDYYLRSIYF